MGLLASGRDADGRSPQRLRPQNPGTCNDSNFKAPGLDDREWEEMHPWVPVRDEGCEVAACPHLSVSFSRLLPFGFHSPVSREPNHRPSMVLSLFRKQKGLLSFKENPQDIAKISGSHASRWDEVVLLVAVGVPCPSSLSGLVSHSLCGLRPRPPPSLPQPSGNELVSKELNLHKRMKRGGEEDLKSQMAGFLDPPVCNYVL